MEKQDDKIKAGIVFEEDVIHVLAADIQGMQEFKDLPKTVSERIVRILTKMKADSERHRTLLLALAEKY